MKNCLKCGKEFKPSKGLISYCSLACRNSRIRTEEIKKKISESSKKSEKVKLANRNKLHKIKVPKISSKCLLCNKDIWHSPKRKRKYHAECWLKASGGYRKNSTRNTRCEYKGIQLDSGAEKAFALLCDKFQILWKKNRKEFFKYFDSNNKQHRYYPDFYLPEYKTWVEVKGKFYENKDPLVEFKYNCMKDKKFVLIYSNEIDINFLKSHLSMHGSYASD